MALSVLSVPFIISPQSRHKKAAHACTLGSLIGVCARQFILAQKSAKNDTLLDRNRIFLRIFLLFFDRIWHNKTEKAFSQWPRVLTLMRLEPFVSKDSRIEFFYKSSEFFIFWKRGWNFSTNLVKFSLATSSQWIFKGYFVPGRLVP